MGLSRYASEAEKSNYLLFIDLFESRNSSQHVTWKRSGSVNTIVVPYRYFNIRTPGVSAVSAGRRLQLLHYSIPCGAFPTSKTSGPD